MNDTIKKPAHYHGAGIEVIDVIEAFDLNFRTGNAAKYLLRAGRKGDAIEDLEKSQRYIGREIAKRRGAPGWGDEAESRPDIWYLATPYTKYKHGIERAFTDAAKLAAKLLSRGLRVYSPITHTHPLAIHGNLDPLDHTIWMPFDEAMMHASSGLLVAHMSGWRESKGVAHEIAFFERAGKPICDLDTRTLYRKTRVNT